MNDIDKNSELTKEETELLLKKLERENILKFGCDHNSNTDICDSCKIKYFKELESHI